MLPIKILQKLKLQQMIHTDQRHRLGLSRHDLALKPSVYEGYLEPFRPSQEQSLPSPLPARGAELLDNPIDFASFDEEYWHLDQNPYGPTPPYQNPRDSGEQLRYGGRDYHPKDLLEAYSDMSKADEGPDGKSAWGRKPED
ncbi:hypothetical protein CPC08DRAFT_47186 [Agrocybe pediades]|nr:hypothetical protein CPC08DRAFT_47186 [Agrocybe pediades]